MILSKNNSQQAAVLGLALSDGSAEALAKRAPKTKLVH